jgi:uncharacterized protein (DUF1800 family)
MKPRTVFHQAAAPGEVAQRITSPRKAEVAGLLRESVVRPSGSQALRPHDPEEATAAASHRTEKQQKHRRRRILSGAGAMTGGREEDRRANPVQTRPMANLPDERSAAVERVRRWCESDCAPSS